MCWKRMHLFYINRHGVEKHETNIVIVGITSINIHRISLAAPRMIKGQPSAPHFAIERLDARHLE